MADDAVSKIGKVEGTPETETVTFSGDALGVLDLLKDRLSGVNSRKAVVVRAVEIVYSAVDKQILLRSPDGSTSVLPVWTEEVQ